MRTLIATILALLVAGCASEPSLEEAPKAGVEDRAPGALKPGAPSAAPVRPAPGPAAKPMAPGAGAAKPLSPLKDPANILSKRSIFYDYDSDTIKDEYRPLIQAHAKYLAANPGAKALIQGNADERGSREYNIGLGQRRADGVKRMLVLLGARDGQIEAVSLGEEKPRCTDTTETCYSQNRRSDILHAGEF
jgi:peptidoglycan-associated lipoprotein